MRSKFTSNEFLARLKSGTFDYVKQTILWFMYDSYQNMITNCGLPTDSDVQGFKQVFLARKNLTAYEKIELLAICDTYVSELFENNYAEAA